MTEHKKPPKKSGGFLLNISESSPGPFSPSKCDPARARTEDPQIKSLLLYQLSYGVENGMQI